MTVRAAGPRAIMKRFMAASVGVEPSNNVTFSRPRRNLA
jgi:hypothetical protein